MFQGDGAKIREGDAYYPIGSWNPLVHVEAGPSLGMV
jgi:hypothetical protein